MHNVGDIVYSTIPESGKIVPLKIIEIITVKNLEEEKTEYKVVLPTKTFKKLSLSKFNRVFESIDEIKDYLLGNAKNAIENMVDEALDLEERHFHKLQKEIKNKVDENFECKNEPEYVKIDLGDGQVGKIKPDFIHKEIHDTTTKESSDSWRI